MEYSKSHIYDGFVSLERGMDSGRTPASLARNQTAFAINTTFRGGYPECRPGWIKREVLFKTSTGANNTTLMAAFRDGRYQGGAYYDGGDSGESCLLAGIAGKLYKVSVEQNYRATDITPATSGSSRLPKWWFCQAEEFMVCQDGQSRPIVYDGGSTRRLTKDNELPVGRTMAYAGGRVWVALAEGYRFIAGDLAYGSSGTSKYGLRDAVLKVTENEYLAGGGYFAMPGNSGGIASMVATSNLDSALGQGPLLILTPQLVASVQAPIERTAWQNLQYPIQTVALHGYGALGDRSPVTVNGDVFYRAEDGIRSFKLARRDFGQWGNTPSSAEMNRVLEEDSRNLLDYASSVVFDNRLLSTVSPYWVQGHGVPHRGLAVLDFDILSRMNGAQPPAWEGIWTGANVLQLIKGRFNGVERSFAFVLNGANQIELWELTRDHFADTGDSGDSRIEWSVELKALDFDTPFSLKALEYGELWVDKLTGKVNISAEWRPDEYPKWQTWHSGWDEEATRTQTMTSLLSGQATPREQYRAKLKLNSPDYVSDSVSDSDLRNFFTVQPRVQFIGHCRLRQCRVVARPVTERPRGKYST